jgi:outer membrane protein W
MKQTILILLLISIIPYSFGQFYIQPSTGYTFSSHPAEVQSTLVVDNHKTVYVSKLKYGEGMHLGLNLGYDLYDNIFVEVIARKSFYSKFNVSTVQPDLQSLKSFSFSGYFGEIDYENPVFQIAPLIGYKIQKQKYSTYFKLGPNLMKARVNQTFKYINWEFDNWELYPLNTVMEYEYSGKFHIGLQANIGLDYSIKDNLHLVFDFVTVYNNYRISNAEIKYFEIDGVSHLYKIENTIEVDKDDNKLNFSHYGISIGFKYVLRWHTDDTDQAD